MKRVGKEPRLLPSVMEAIASLKEKNGSTQRQIVDHIAHIFKKNRDGSRNMTVQVRRALEHGLNSGLIRQRSGKYTLGLDRKDYAIFRRFRHLTDPLGDCNTCKRGRRRGRRGRRGRRRRSRRRGRRGRKKHLSNEDDLSDETESGRSVTGGTPEPMDRGRRRRRRGRKGRRRGRRGRRHSAPNEDGSDSSEVANKQSNQAIPPEKRRSEQDKVEYQSKTGSNHNHHQERNNNHQGNSNNCNQDQDEDDAVECGNPDCLCNIKQEDDSPRCMSRENNYYNDSYLN